MEFRLVLFRFDIRAQPMRASLPTGTRMIATGVITPVMGPIKVTLLAAFILALPIVLYQAWAFVAPGLYKNEQRLAIPLILSSTFLFLLGMAFCYFVVFRTVFHFIANFAPQSITPAPDRSEEHTSELQSLMRISSAVFCLTKKNKY